MHASRFWGDKGGNFAIATALLAMPLIVAAGTAVDVVNMIHAKSDVQAALDAASMAVALEVPSGKSDEALEQLGDDHFKAQLDPSAFPRGVLADLQYLGLTSDQDGSQHVTTSVSFTYDYQMADVFRDDALQAEAGSSFDLTARVTVRPGGLACIYALSRTASRALTMSGNTAVRTDGCVLAANSAAADAIYVGGSASVAADCLQSAGGIDADDGLTVDCAANRTGAWPLPDPFAHLAEPVPPVLLANPGKKDTKLQPGRYRNLSLDGVKHLEPGLYYIEGDLSMKGDITGTGVTFFLKDGGVTINGNAKVALSAPPTGDLAGMLFMSAKDNPSSHKFNGSGEAILDGFLYFPQGELTYSGNNSTASTCLRMVADTIVLTGSSDLAADCTQELGGREARVSGPPHFTR